MDEHWAAGVTQVSPILYKPLDNLTASTVQIAYCITLHVSSIYGFQTCTRNPDNGNNEHYQEEAFRTRRTQEERTMFTLWNHTFAVSFIVKADTKQVHVTSAGGQWTNDSSYRVISLQVLHTKKYRIFLI